MPKFWCNKLGLDKGLESFKTEGVTTTYKMLSGKELQEELKRKLIEEAQEVKDAHTQDEVTIELADVLEVIDGICKAYGIDKNELMRAKEEKYKKRGGFETGYYVEYIEMDEDNPKVNYFRSLPDRYPED
jgi:predicted house-cleaning noncanonical NTP pyrophosphatase (MazG superfamily)